MSSIQSHYQTAIKFATAKHVAQNQLVKGSNLPYVVHLSNVAMETMIAATHTEGFDLDYAVQVALLHDTIEDTETTYEEIAERFGKPIADGVLALSKDETLHKDQQTQDSLNRVKKLRKEVWAVKLADRITNLQVPPSDWNKQKRIAYREDARLILKELKEGNRYLAERLEEVIEGYSEYLK
jgi:guanosine-3',5'-bis(diphosphate) 3'-pyrophosphohydrolase